MISMIAIMLIRFIAAYSIRLPLSPVSGESASALSALMLTTTVTPFSVILTV
ncbi:MAG: hypothetical protein IKE12_04775 [Erysipelotrichaceae bacterium]|nr:hypothetical protein [Erysipelotrichaceae bacterium]